ncbi:hypothetical protein L6R29_24345 [Myxococcota bacterium]|nr:hypothetical protein [Myxococcota bacterium]
MTLKMTEQTIDLSDLEYRDYSEEETKGFRRVRSNFSRLLQPVLQKLEADASLLPSVEVSYTELAKKAQHVVDLENAEAWLTEKLEHISETRRAINSELKPHLDRVTDLARASAKVNPKVADLFAEFFDYLAEPTQKAAATLANNKKG